jgi:hypothetical protein
MDLTEGSETSANINQTPGNHPKVDILNTEHGESLKSMIMAVCKGAATSKNKNKTILEYVLYDVMMAIQIGRNM